MTRERDRYRQNTEALLTDMRRIQVDSTRMAVDVKTLRLTVSEFEEYRAQDAKLIRRLGVRVKDLEAAARHHLLVEAPIVAPVRDSVIARDTVFVPVQSVEMINPHIEFKGVIEDSVLTADVRIPVTLNQAVFVEYRHKFLWWRWKVKGVRQIITSDNPYVEIEYSEYIRIEKKK
ncbi:MAG: hypothetical protein LBU98_06480 [Alistipes sp.]|nr:hypothetical protein [Alistipes sp.]